MSQLQALLQDAQRRSGLGIRAIAREAQRHGHDISANTVSVYINSNNPPAPTSKTLDALASALPVTADELRSAAGMAQDLGDWQPPAEARAMNTQQRRIVEEVIRQFTINNTQAQREESNRDQDRATDFYKFAARRNPTGRFDTDGTGSDISS